MGCDVIDGYVINLEPKYKYNLFRQIVETLKDNNSITNKDSTFSMNSLNIKMTSDEKVRYQTILQTLFEEAGEGLYKLQLQGALQMIVDRLQRENKEVVYEDLVNEVKDGMSMLLPASFLSEFDETTLNTGVEIAIKRVFLVADNQEFNGPVSSYQSRNIMVIQSDIDLMSENPVERQSYR